MLSIEISNIREFAEPPHFQVDDSPYGGGAGMVMKPEPLCAAIEAAKAKDPQAPVMLMSPSGEQFSQAHALSFSKLPGLILVCGRYEGIDQRVIDLLVDREISIGDYVLMGGELPAMVLIEASARLLDDVVGNPDSLRTESFCGEKQGPLLEAPHYTRPAEFRGLKVPQVLLCGDHAKVAAWRSEQSLARTTARRSDLLEK